MTNPPLRNTTTTQYLHIPPPTTTPNNNSVTNGDVFELPYYVHAVTHDAQVTSVHLRRERKTDDESNSDDEANDKGFFVQFDDGPNQIWFEVAGLEIKLQVAGFCTQEGGLPSDQTSVVETRFGGCQDCTFAGNIFRLIDLGDPQLSPQAWAKHMREHPWMMKKLADWFLHSHASMSPS